MEAAVEKPWWACGIVCTCILKVEDDEGGGLIRFWGFGEERNWRSRLGKVEDDEGGGGGWWWCGGGRCLGCVWK